MQAGMVHWAPLHGMRHPPVLEQSMLQVEPGLQVVSQLDSVHSTSQVVLAAQLVLQPPAGQENEQVRSRVSQPNAQ